MAARKVNTVVPEGTDLTVLLRTFEKEKAAEYKRGVKEGKAAAKEQAKIEGQREADKQWARKHEEMKQHVMSLAECLELYISEHYDYY